MENLNQDLIKACTEGNIELVETLIKKGADVNFSNNYAISIAAKGGYLEIVKLLIKNGADIYDNENAASRWATAEIRKYLIELQEATFAGLKSQIESATSLDAIENIFKKERATIINFNQYKPEFSEKLREVKNDAIKKLT